MTCRKPLLIRRNKNLLCLRFGFGFGFQLFRWFYFVALSDFSSERMLVFPSCFDPVVICQLPMCVLGSYPTRTRTKVN